MYRRSVRGVRIAHGSRIEIRSNFKIRADWRNKRCVRELNYRWTRGWALDRVHNSRRPLELLFAFCEPVTLIFDLLIYYLLMGEASWWAIPVPSLVTVFSAVFCFSCTQIYTHKITDAANRLTHVYNVGVSHLPFTVCFGIWRIDGSQISSPIQFIHS